MTNRNDSQKWTGVCRYYTKTKSTHKSKKMFLFQTIQVCCNDLHWEIKKWFVVHTCWTCGLECARILPLQLFGRFSLFVEVGRAPCMLPMKVVGWILVSVAHFIMSIKAVMIASISEDESMVISMYSSTQSLLHSRCAWGDAYFKGSLSSSLSRFR